MPNRHNRFLAEWLPTDEPKAGDSVIVVDPATKDSEFRAGGGGGAVPPAEAEGQLLVSGEGPGFFWDPASAIDAGTY